jgi:hypothetical protein
MQRAIVAVVLVVGEAVAVFRTLEQRQQVGVAPAGVARRRPAIVVVAVAAGVHHGVDGAGASQHLAARLKALAPAESLLRRGEVMPAVHQAPGHHDDEAHRGAHEHRTVGATGLQHAHSGAGVFAQAPRQGTPGGAAANDHVVKFLSCHGNPSSRFSSAQRAGREKVWHARPCPGHRPNPCPPRRSHSARCNPLCPPGCSLFAALPRPQARVRAARRKRGKGRPRTSSALRASSPRPSRMSRVMSRA